MTTDATTRSRSLVDLLGEQRAAIVQWLRDAATATVAELSAHLGISEVATRRHVDRLAADGLIAAETVNRGRGRPVATWSLTDRGKRLFPTRYAELANELLDYLAEVDRAQLGAFLRWRQERQVAGYAEVVDADDVRDRLEQLADALSVDGYRATVDEDGDGFTLRQTHCAIEDVARDHQLVCAHEAAAFGRLLGDEVRVSRRETIAKGHAACVCHVQLREPQDDTLPVVADTSPSPCGADALASPRGTTVPARPHGATAPTDLPPTREDAS